MIELTHAQLLERLHYDPVTGHFTWVANRGRCAKKGEHAGWLDRDGYVVINLRIDGKQGSYRAHRLAWFYIHGYWPPADIDHKYGDHSDNRLSELREATRSQNLANILAHKDNKTGAKGVSFDRRRQTYYARITKDGHMHHLGSYADLESARLAYADAARRLFGEFAWVS